jgi:accessory gene regulator B
VVFLKGMLSILSLMARKMSSFSISNGIIKEEEREIYNYSFELLLSTIINFGFIIIASIIFNKVVQTLFYLIGFLPLRRVAGGFHAKTHLRCFFVLLASYFMFLSILILIADQSINILILAILLFSLCIVFLFSPIEDKNRPISLTEKDIFQRKSRIIILFLIIVVSILTLYSKQLALSLSLGVLTVDFSLIAAKLINSIPKYKN